MCVCVAWGVIEIITDHYSVYDNENYEGRCKLTLLTNKSEAIISHVNGL